jgi:prohibitin 2
MFLIKLILIGLAIGLFVVLSLKKKDSVARGEVPVSWNKFGSLIGVCILLLAIIVTSSIGYISSGHKGVVTRWGAITGRVIPEGIYMVVPISDSVHEMTVQLLMHQADASAASKDLQEVKTKITLNFYPDPSMVATIYKTMREDYIVRIVDPAIQEAVKASTAQFDAEKLITERPLVKEKMFLYLKQRLAEQNLIAESIQITDFDFSPSFKQAIEEKVTASQLAFKAERDLQRIKTEAQQKIETAKAEAESLRIQKAQVTPELVELRKIEMQKIAISKWNGVMPTTVTGNGPVPILDVFQHR